MGIKYILMDIDDTIFDFIKSEKIAVSKTMKAFDIDPTEEMVSLYSQINDMHWKALERKEITREQVVLGRFEVFLKEIGSNADAKKMRDLYVEHLSREVYYFEGAEDFLNRMKKKYTLIAVSNGTKKVQEGRFEKSGVRQYFSQIFISEDLKYDKPAKEFFDIVFRNIPNFKKEDSIMFGDSLTSDILGGIHAGVRTCWYNPKKKENNTEIKPDYVVNNYYEFETLVSSLT